MTFVYFVGNKDQLTNWRESIANGDYAHAEAAMLAETDRGEGFFPINEVRAEFYESWADSLDHVEEKVAKFRAAQHNWEQWASCSTSGGEGTARMSEVHRVMEKLELLDAD